MIARDHYQRAFEAYVRQRRLPYVSVDEARRAILPDAGPLRMTHLPGAGASTLKSFDFVVYGPGSNLLVEVKGRKVARRRPVAEPARRASERLLPLTPPPRVRLESWVTQDDVDSLKVWEDLFGPGFLGVFVFVYWCDQLPPSALFEEFVELDARWYAIRCVTRAAYQSAMRVRSPRWRTVHLPPEAFDRLSRPLTTVQTKSNHNPITDHSTPRAGPSLVPGAPGGR